MRKRIGVVVIVVLAGLAAFVVWYSRLATHETEEVLYPEPGERTEFRLGEIAVAMGRFYDAHQRLPLTLGELDSAATRLRSRPLALVDSWGGSIMYEAADSSYVLRSPGPDGIDRTSDDLILVERRPYHELPVRHR